MSVVTTGRRLDRFLSDLSALVEVLPSPDVKARMDADLASLIKFLQGFRARLSSLPTDEGADQIASTIEAVKDFVRIAEADPVMSRVLGLSKQARPNGRPRRKPATRLSIVEKIAKSLANRWGYEHLRGQRDHHDHSGARVEPVPHLFLDFGPAVAG